MLASNQFGADTVKKKILITSVGSNVGGNILLSLAHRRDEFHFIGTNLLAETAFMFMCDEGYLVPPVADRDAFVAATADIIRNTEPDVILAGRDEDVSVLASMKEESWPGDPVFLVPSMDAAQVSNDKYHSACFAAENDLPFVRSAIQLDEATAIAEDVGFPVIAKPYLNGHGSKDVFIVRTQGELEAVMARGGFIVQEMIGHKGTPESYNPVSDCGVPLFYSYAIEDQISCQALVGKSGKVLCCTATNNFYSFGRSHKYIPVGDPAVLDVVRRYAEALAKIGMFGPLNLQGKLDTDGALKIYEINMRFTGATQGRQMIDWSEVEFALDHVLYGKDVQLPPSPVGRLRAIREPFAYTLEDSKMDALKATGYWKKTS